MQNLEQALIDKPDQSRHLRVVCKDFTAEYGECVTHGRYPKNTLDNDGTVRWFSLQDCPACHRQKRLESLFAEGGFGNRHLHCTFDNYDATVSASATTALKRCQKFVAEFDQNLSLGRCIVLHGNPGTGKNHLATAIVKKAFECKYSALLICANEYLDAYWGLPFGERSKFINGLRSADLLVLDEIGRIPDTEPTRDALFTLINARYTDTRSTIVIANLARGDLISRIGQPTYERLAENHGLRLSFEWGSYRTGAGR